MGLYITFPITILIEVVFPVVLGYWVIHRYHTKWRLVGIGALIFLVSQMVHIPMLDGINWLFTNNVLPTPKGYQLVLLNAVIGGLAAGLCEETARLVGFKLLKQPVQNEGGAFSLGVGHGGMESILIAGLPMALTFLSMVALKNANPSDPSMDPVTVLQIANMWKMSWITPLASALERLVAMTTQIALTLIILQVFIRKSYWFFVIAIFWHALVDGLVVGLEGTNASSVMILSLEVVLGLISAGIIWYLVFRPMAKMKAKTPN
jgi:uncharacterized membrane protein YhfC